MQRNVMVIAGGRDGVSASMSVRDGENLMVDVCSTIPLSVQYFSKQVVWKGKEELGNELARWVVLFCNYDLDINPIRRWGVLEFDWKEAEANKEDRPYEVDRILLASGERDGFENADTTHPRVSAEAPSLSGRFSSLTSLLRILESLRQGWLLDPVLIDRDNKQERTPKRRTSPQLCAVSELAPSWRLLVFPSV